MVAMILSLVFVILMFVGIVSRAKDDLKNRKDIWDLMGFKD